MPEQGKYYGNHKPVKHLNMQTELTSEDVFKISITTHQIKCVQVNSHWLLTNGYYRERRQINKVRKTYYIKVD